MNEDLARLRCLDIDDLYMLSQRGEGRTLVSISKDLLLTPPALSLRTRKHILVFGILDCGQRGRGKPRPLNENGLRVARKCEMALQALLED